MAYYAANVLLALPSGTCICGGVYDESKRCPPCTILQHRERVMMSMSRWESPVKRADRADAGWFPGGAVCVTVDEGERVPPPEARLVFDHLNDAVSSRLVIFGHGDPASKTVGGRTPKELRKLVVQGCGVCRVTKISLLACYGGGNFDQGGPRVETVDSFAREFHGQLATKGQLFADLSARTRAMTTNPLNVRTAHIRECDQYVPKAPESKYLFRWADTGYGKEQDIQSVRRRV